MSFFDRGIYLEQHKEPAISKKLRVAEGISFKPFDAERYLSVADEYVYKIIEISKIRDEHTGEFLLDIVNRALQNGAKKLVVNAVDDDPYTSSSSTALFRLKEYAMLGARLVAKVLSTREISCAVNANVDIDVPEFKIPETVCGEDVKKIDGKYPIAIRLQEHYREKIAAVGSCALISLAKMVIDGEIPKICFVTVAGDCVEDSANVVVPIGTQIKDLFEMCSLNKEPQKIILGSMMTGRPVESMEVGVDFNTKTVVALSKYTVKTGLNCIGCGRCVRVCPQGLSPYYMYKSSKRGIDAPTLLKLAENCILCGCCSHICPGTCNPTHYIRLLKNKNQSLQTKEG